MTIAHLLPVIGVLALIAGCGTLDEKPIENREPLIELDEARVTGAIPAEPQFVITKVFFATDRNLSEKPGETFGVQRGSSLSYGFCKVSIPRDHRMGSLEAPSIWKLERRKDPSKHVVLLRTAIQPKEEFFKDVAIRVKASSGKKAFIFVHGYNVTFEDAARRTAQMSYDLGFDGAPVFYSWPSQGLLTPIGYTTDEQNIEWSQANFRRFLEDFFARSDAQDVYLVAHSMGNRSLTRAVASLLTDTPSIKERLKEIILNAPDIDAEVFRRDIAPVLTASGRPVTLYASSTDFALAMSKKVHGFPRAGDTGRGLIISPGIETIDATNTDTSFVGHSYYAERRSILSDMFYLVTEGHRADTRFGLKKIITPRGSYWEIKK